MRDAAPYAFLFKADGTPKLDEVIEFREAVEDMPPYQDTFRATAYLDRSTVKNFRREPKLLYFVDSWLVPEWLPSGRSAAKSRFINPNGSSIERFSLSGVECACGNVITDIERNTPIAETHAEGCTAEDRRTVVRRMKDLRLHRIITGAHLNQSWSEIAPSLGVAPRTVGDVCDEYGIEWTRLRDVGRHRMAATIDILRDQGYTYAEIGEAFGSSDDHIRHYSIRKVFNRRSESVA